MSAETVKKPSKKKKAAKIKKTKESEAQKLDVGKAKDEDSDIVMKEGVQGKEGEAWNVSVVIFG